MASFNKFNSFVEAVAEKTHNLQSDTLMVALSNTLPTASNTQLSNITEVSYANCSSRALTVATSAQTSGTYKLVVNDITLTASGGTVGPFQYIIIYNNTATNKELIGFFDRGAAITLQDGDTFLLDFDGTNGLLQIS
jgi:hypothetical protein